MHDAYMRTDTYDDCIERALVAHTWCTRDMHDAYMRTDTYDDFIARAIAAHT